MWCRRCRQDVPGIALATGKGIGCARCGHRLSESTASRRFDQPTGVADITDSGLDLGQLSQATGATGGPASKAGGSSAASEAGGKPVLRENPLASPSAAAGEPGQPLHGPERRAEPAHASTSPEPADAASPKRRKTAGPPRMDLDDWDLDSLDSSLSAIGDFAATPPAQPWNMAAGPDARGASWRVTHTAHAARRPAAASVRKRRRAARRSAMFTWAIIGAGLHALLAAGGLGLASVLIPQPALSPWIWPTAAAGQALLLVGLALQLERIGHANSEAREELAIVHARLNDLRRTTTLAAAPPASSPQAFYKHLAEGANPQMLLADVKGQLDLLAARMSQ